MARPALPGPSAKSAFTVPLQAKLYWRYLRGHPLTRREMVALPASCDLVVASKPETTFCTAAWTRAAYHKGRGQVPRSARRMRYFRCSSNLSNTARCTFALHRRRTADPAPAHHFNTLMATSLAEGRPVLTLARTHPLRDLQETPYQVRAPPRFPKTGHPYQRKRSRLLTSYADHKLRTCCARHPPLGPLCACAGNR